MALHYGNSMVKSVIGTGPDVVDCRKYVLKINDQNFYVNSVNLESLISISILGNLIPQLKLSLQGMTVAGF